MDLRTLLITGDSGLAELLRPQVENQGGLCVVAETYDDARASFEWADAVMLDLELPEGGVEVLTRLRVELPAVPVVAIAATAQAASAVVDQADRVLLEPFSIADVVDAIRSLIRSPDPATIDLRGDGTAVAAADDAPWWATR
jgi:DNA-binding response OmpR family regulator